MRLYAASERIEGATSIGFNASDGGEKNNHLHYSDRESRSRKCSRCEPSSARAHKRKNMDLVDGIINSRSGAAHRARADLRRKVLDVSALSSSMEHANRSHPDMVKLDAEDTLDQVLVYYCTELSYLINAVAKQIVERQLIRPVPQVPSPGLEAFRGRATRDSGGKGASGVHEEEDGGSAGHIQVESCRVLLVDRRTRELTGVLSLATSLGQRTVTLAIQVVENNIRRMLSQTLEKSFLRYPNRI